jgi:prefoldin subunit 5
MAEGGGGVTEYQLLQADIVNLQKQKADVEAAEKTSIACARIIASIKAAEGKDGFLVKEGETNQFHSAGPSSGGGGCCAVQ